MDSAFLVDLGGVTGDPHRSHDLTITTHEDASRHREPKYIAHPSTWLNQERWEDTPVTDTNRPVAPANGRHVSTAHALAGWEA